MFRSGALSGRKQAWPRGGFASFIATSVMLFNSSTASAQALDVLHAFAGSTEPAFPIAGLIIGTDGNLYGTSVGGGADGFGTVFRMTPAGAITTLYSFKGSDGGAPMAELGQGADGFFYGYTSGFTTPAVSATLFRMSADGLEPSFTFESRGESPQRAGLIKATDEGLYGPFTTTNLCFIRRVSGNGSFNSNSSSLPNSVCADGTILGALVQAADGALYGTSSRGGAFDEGTVFRWNLAGTVIVHEFTGGAEGALPRSLILGTDGNFYGTTESGGAFNRGTIFRVASDGTFTVLYAFEGGADGSGPSWPLTQPADGDFYGTAPGGAFNQGVAFKITPAGDFSVLHTFSGGQTDGAHPQSRLLAAPDGTFYGTTTFGGINDLGTVFRMTASGSVTLSYSFGTGADGALARAPLLQASDGNLYGTTMAGGIGHGTVFKTTPAGQLRTIHAFTGGSAGGAAPVAGLIQASDGNLYGTTSSGGGADAFGGAGTVFKVTPAGDFTLLHAFDGLGSDGAQPAAALVEAGDGSFFGTTAAGGAFGLGTVFRITSDGTLNTLHDFEGAANGNGDGAQPRGALKRATDGSFYGTTALGGTFNRGTVFRMTAAGSVSVLHAFTGGIDGAVPFGSLVQASHGHLYGTTSANGAFGGGTVFRVAPGSPGSLATLHGFRASEGVSPLAGLVQAADGFFYGTTPSGGTFGNGVVFRIALHATPIPPSAVVVTSGPGSIRLAWSSVATATSYTVTRIALAGAATVVASSLTTTTFDDLGVTNGQTYRYIVSAVNAAGEGVGSYEVSMTAGRAVRGDFDGDGKTDIAVFRPPTGTWYVRGVTTGVWGSGADLPVPGDYDGDMRTDIAVYRPQRLDIGDGQSSKLWDLVPSSLGSGKTVPWGGGADVPAPADYDGDGTTDIGVFRPSTGEWFILQSRTQMGRVAVWGGGGDVPVAHDYDGDGKADIAVFRPSTGTWFILQSQTQTGRVTTWGGGADIPVAADYDGDGKADIAVFRRSPSTGLWFVLRSSTGTGSTTMLGGGADAPVPGDYDGDGKTDMAVFRPSTGAWFIIQTSTATGAMVTWGGGADIPVLTQP